MFSGLLAATRAFLTTSSLILFGNGISAMFASSALTTVCGRTKPETKLRERRTVDSGTRHRRWLWFALHNFFQRLRIKKRGTKLVKLLKFIERDTKRLERFIRTTRVRV
jgi:hypothetical protein